MRRLFHALQDYLFPQAQERCHSGIERYCETHITPLNLEIGIIRTDGGKEFVGCFHSLLDRAGINYDCTPPHTTQRNGVVERTLGLLRDKTAALLRSVIEEKPD